MAGHGKAWRGGARRGKARQSKQEFLMTASKIATYTERTIQDIFFFFHDSLDAMVESEKDHLREIVRRAVNEAYISGVYDEQINLRFGGVPTP